ncbi:MAG: C40 family peptidase [Thermoleophilia bacterium]
MKYLSTKRAIIMIRILLAAFLGLLMLLTPTGLALAEPDPAEQAQQRIQTIEDQANAVRGELANLNLELEKVVEHHNTTRFQLDQLTMQLADSRHLLDNASAQYDTQEKLMSNRLGALYRAGEVNIVSVLINSNSLSDFYEQTVYMAKINEQDAKLEKQFKESADNIRTLTDDIDRKRSMQLSLERELSGQKEQIQAGIAGRQQRIEQLDGRVREIFAREAERVRAEQAQAAAEAAAMLRDLEISDETQAQVVQTTLQYLGVPYVWGGESPSGFDCSGLVKYVYAQYGVQLPHASSIQFRMGMPVPPNQLQPGDLVFFYGAAAPQHVGMYIGKGKYVEAPNFGEVVKISTLSFDSDYAGAQRYPLQRRTPVGR